jgi:outer membrane putative beta-barrel porin/alpha-amylase
MTRARSALIVVACFCTAAADADEARWSFSTGADYTNGDYGETQDTTIVIVPFAVAYKTDWWSARLTVPYVTIDGPGTIVPGSTDGASGGSGGLLGAVGGLLDDLLGGGAAAGPAAAPPTPTTIHESGLGDITFALGVVPWSSDDGTKLTLTGRVRAPTSDADRFLGIDDTALAISTTLSHSFSGQAAIYGSIGYEHAFESQANALFAQVGAESYVIPRVLLGGSVDWAQASSELRRDSTQAGVYVGYDATSEWRLLVYGSAGLTDTSPDIGAGMRVVFTPE